MIIGVPKEIKDHEGRVSATPAAVEAFVKSGHKVYVEKTAGIQSGFSDEEYQKAGAILTDTAEEVWTKSELIYKVKEPLESEYKYFREGLILFTYLHLASAKDLTEKLMESKTVGIAFETVQLGHTLPLLRPMSEIAGRMAVQEGARYLTSTEGGKGILIEGVPGVAPAHVVILGAGTVGTAAARVAVGMGARVTVLDVNIERLGELLGIFSNTIETRYSNNHNIADAVESADLVISTVLIPGHKTPQLISEEMVKKMDKGSVIVDVAIDQGGSTDLTVGHATSHTDPVFVAHDVIHYAVGNIPGAVPRTSSQALSNATTKYALAIANLGWKEAAKKYPELYLGINVQDGKIRYEGVAEALNLPYEKLEI
ncbi:MAG: alanine dehydrogenase [Peptoniphilaceae bacterium]|nr:alanine dehydrogenase [Peptoniphilaceae bacterium]MDY6019351.1 alanine dehydrogenase [Anaerococcus sp.]